MSAITILEYWKEFAASVAVIGTFFVGRNSAKILERKNNADAVSTMQKTYDAFLDHYNKQHNMLIERISTLELRNAVLAESSQSWESKFRSLERDHENLKKEFERYKKLHETK